NHSQQNDNEMRLTLVGSSFLDSRRLAGRGSSLSSTYSSNLPDRLHNYIRAIFLRKIFCVFCKYKTFR
ncbi:hypothetical protein, partial [Methanolobus bombayensis]|uniref:hypothetical protein n=1 Tax=Methanolobus bombayensis TaxID=38023 RepID=UPI001AE6F823